MSTDRVARAETSGTTRVVWMISPDEGDSFALLGEYDDLRWLALSQHLVRRGFEVASSLGEGLPSAARPAAVVLNGLNRTAPQAGRLVRRVRSLLPEVPLYVTGRAAVEVASAQPPALAVQAASEDALAVGLLPDGSLSSATPSMDWWQRLTPDRSGGPKAPLGVLDVEATRGCTHACTFCSVGLGPDGYQRGWAPRAPREVAAEVKRWAGDTGASRVQFVDDNFLGSSREAAAWAREVAVELRRLVPALRFSVYARLDPTLLDCLDDLRSAGLVQIHSGVESASPRMLRILRKGVSRQTLDRVYDRVVEHGVEVVPSFIMFDPRAQPADVRDTLDWIRKRDLEAWFTPTTALPYAGTVLTEELAGTTPQGSVFLGRDGRPTEPEFAFSSVSVGRALAVARELDAVEGARLSPPLDTLMRIRMRRDAELLCAPVDGDADLRTLARHRARQMALVAAELEE